MAKALLQGFELLRAPAGRWGRGREGVRLRGRCGADAAHHAGGREQLEQKVAPGLGEEVLGTWFRGAGVADVGYRLRLMGWPGRLWLRC